MAKSIIYNEDARRALEKGMDLLAEAVAGQAERFDVMASVPQASFPGGAALRWPFLVLAMAWYSMRDRLGV
jgi:gamma-glutamylputrescine oxidase